MKKNPERMPASAPWLDGSRWWVVLGRASRWSVPRRCLQRGDRCAGLPLPTSPAGFGWLCDIHAFNLSRADEERGGPATSYLLSPLLGFRSLGPMTAHTQQSLLIGVCGSGSPGPRFLQVRSLPLGWTDWLGSVVRCPFPSGAPAGGGAGDSEAWCPWGWAWGAPVHLECVLSLTSFRVCRDAAPVLFLDPSCPLCQESW